MKQRRMASMILRGAVLLLVGLVALGGQGPSRVQAANGDNLRTIIAGRAGTKCASINQFGNHLNTGLGIAFDGTNLLLSCVGDNTVTAVSPANGAQVAVHHIEGAISLGALAYDRSNNRLYGCSNQRFVGTIDLTANTFTTVFDTLTSGGTGCFDGLAYDGTNGTIWASGGDSATLQHFTLAEVVWVLISSNSVALGGCDNTGVAVGGPKLYLGNNDCKQIYEVAKDFSTSVPFASLTSPVGDLECDDVTFAATSGAIWSMHAHNNILNAWEIPTDQCASGGGGEPEPRPGRMTGGGTVGTSDVRHGFELQCDRTKTPNNLEVNWGKKNKFHLESLATAACTDAPDIDEGQPVAGFDTYEGSGLGRYNGVSGYNIRFTFTDAGEPGEDDTASINIVGPSGSVISVSGSISKGNHQAHAP